MKKWIIGVISVFLAGFVAISAAGLSGCKSEDTPLLRLHIRANSNSAADQAVKLIVRDRVVEYLERELGEVDDFERAKTEISRRKSALTSICNQVLAAEGFDYKAEVEVKNEFFPTRMYEDIVIESGYYDALLIHLGQAAGDNWWCVIYPPLCYLEAQFGDGFKYKSKIKELWDKHFG